jgi:hypothetical protein
LGPTGLDLVIAWQLWAGLHKVDHAGVSAASDVTVVVVVFFGHADGEEQAARNPGVDGASAMASPRSGFRGWTRGQWTVECIERVRRFFRAKA